MTKVRLPPEAYSTEQGWVVLGKIPYPYIQNMWAPSLMNCRPLYSMIPWSYLDTMPNILRRSWNKVWKHEGEIWSLGVLSHRRSSSCCWNSSNRQEHLRFKEYIISKNFCNIMNVTVLNLKDIFPNETSRVLFNNSYHI